MQCKKSEADDDKLLFNKVFGTLCSVCFRNAERLAEHCRNIAASVLSENNSYGQAVSSQKGRDRWMI